MEDAEEEALQWSSALCVPFAVLMALVYLFLLLLRRGSSPAVRFGATHALCLAKAEYWRFITSSIVHVDLGHLLFDCGFCCLLERVASHVPPRAFILTSALSVLVGAVFSLSASIQLERRFGIPEKPHVGCSSLIFTWLTAQALQPGAAPFYVWGHPLSAHSAPLVAFALSRILFGASSSSFAHIAGGLVGLLFSAGMLDFLNEPRWCGYACLWAALLLCGSLKASTKIRIPLLDSVDLGDGHDRDSVEVARQPGALLHALAHSTPAEENA